MKLKGKLILSCAALAAVATTAFSTTYAWYTSNDTVSATGLKAATDSALSDALQISTDGVNFGTTVSLASVTKDLMPVARTAADKAVGTFKLQGGTDATPGTGSEATATTGIVQFNLYFRNITVASSLYLKSASIVNNTAGGVDTKLIADLQAATGTQGQSGYNAGYTAAANSTYKIDILRALDVEIAVETGTAGEGQPVTTTSVLNTTAEGTAKGSGYTGVSATAYDLEDYLDAAAKDTIANNSLTEWDALTYYNAVKGTSVTRGTGDDAIPATVANSFKTKAVGAKLADTTATTVVKTTWTIYLDGWDKACYDACKGQNVTFDFVFNTTGASA